MKTLFILKEEADETIKTIMQETKNGSDIAVVDLREDQNYDALVGSIETCDRVITW